MNHTLLFATFAAAATIAFAADDPPVTLMTRPGKLIMSESFSKPLPPVEGSTARFASGYKGWRFNVEARGGHWDIVDGTYRGTENAEHTVRECVEIAWDEAGPHRRRRCSPR